MKSQIVLILAILAQPFLGFISPQVLTISFPVLAVVIVGFETLYFRRSNFVGLENILLCFALILCLFRIMPLYAVLIPSAIIIGKFLVSKIEFKLISPKACVCIVLLIGMYAWSRNLDPNFTSLFIAIVLASTDWVSGSRVNLLLLLLSVVVCVAVFKSRAFAYASFVFLLCCLLKPKKNLNRFLLPLMMAFFIVSLFVTFAVTWGHDVVYLYTENNISDIANPSTDNNIIDISNPSFFEKVSNWKDVNRFRISKMWIQDELLANPGKLLWGLNGGYEESIRLNKLYPAHNSYLEIILYFGVIYYLLFVVTFAKALTTSIGFDAVPLLFILSFGMVLHGVLSFGLIPIYFILAKAHQYKFGIDLRI